jgi:hypothetical protein
VIYDVSNNNCSVLEALIKSLRNALHRLVERMFPNGEEASTSSPIFTTSFSLYGTASSTCSCSCSCSLLFIPLCRDVHIDLRYLDLIYVLLITLLF